MKKYFSLFKYEVKTIIRDPMNIFMLSFPLIVFVLGAFVFPTVFDTMAADEGFDSRTLLLLIIVILTFGNYFIAAMATFLLLDHKDECTLNTIAVTPVRAAGYLRFKMTYVYIFSLITTLLVLVGVKYIAGAKYAIYRMSLFDNVGIGKIVYFRRSRRCSLPLWLCSRAPLREIRWRVRVRQRRWYCCVHTHTDGARCHAGRYAVHSWHIPELLGCQGYASAFMPMKASSA